MRITGIILIIIGGLSLLGAIVGLAEGHSISSEGVGFAIAIIVLGAFLISRANKKKEEEEKKKEWIEGKSD